MKRMKLIALLLCAALILTLNACSAEPVETTSATQPTTQATTEPTTVQTTVSDYVDPSVTYHAPMSAVSMPAVTQTSQAADGTTLFTYTYQDMVLFLQDALVADSIVLDHLNRRDDYNASAADLQRSAEAAYSGREGWMPYSLKVQYQPMRFDEITLSFLVTESIFDANTRGNNANISVNYDLLTGKALGIRDILVAEYSAEDLVKLIVQGLSEYEKQELLFPDYEQLISDMFFTNRPFENWYFAQDGLCFFFNPYEIAPYSSGIVTSKVSYDSLGGLLKDNYFPAETVTFAGTPTIQDFATANKDNVTNFSELILDANGKEHLLQADGTLLNVRIETGSWSAGENPYYIPEACVFAATAISKGDAVLIQCDDLSNLLLTYETNGQLWSVPLK